MSAGAAAPALAAYETALGGPEPAGAIYSEASALYLETGKRDKAVKIIETGYDRLQEPPSLTVPMIRTYRLVGRQADADRIAAKCALRWPKMQALCTDEASGKKTLHEAASEFGVTMSSVKERKSASSPGEPPSASTWTARFASVRGEVSRGRERHPGQAQPG
jgi:hypothetical protein